MVKLKIKGDKGMENVAIIIEMGDISVIDALTQTTLAVKKLIEHISHSPIEQEALKASFATLIKEM